MSLLKFEASQQESCGLLSMLCCLQSPDGKVCRCLLSLLYLWCSLTLKFLCWNLSGLDSQPTDNDRLLEVPILSVFGPLSLCFR